MQPIHFQLIDWALIEKTNAPGASGTTSSQTLLLPGLRIRIVEYSSGYLAEHWCQLGHIVYCLEGECTTEMESGARYLLKQGMSYVVSDAMSSHRSQTKLGVKLLIIDGDFLK